MSDSESNKRVDIADKVIIPIIGILETKLKIVDQWIGEISSY